MRQVYMDHAAATPLDHGVLEAMLPYLSNKYGNPASLHRWGEEAKAGVENARAQVAALINSESREIIFTSGGSEANNLAIKGMIAPLLKRGNHVIVSAVEHFSIFHSVKNLEKDGLVEVTYLPVDGYGRVEPSVLREALRPGTILVSITTASSEVGTVQPISDLAAIAKEGGALFHTDAVAAAGVIPIDVKMPGIDALTMASDVIYGPKGAAALYIRHGVRLKPQIDGGIQERGKRAGTENVPAIVGFGAAAEFAREEMAGRATHLVALRDRLISGLTAKIDHLVLNGHPTERLPGNVHVGIEYIEGESMLIFLNMQGIAAASGSACTSRALKASHVLLAMGVPHEKVHGSLLFSLGRDNNEEDVDYVIEALPPIVERLRAMSPMAPG